MHTVLSSGRSGFMTGLVTFSFLLLTAEARNIGNQKQVQLKRYSNDRFHAISVPIWHSVYARDGEYFGSVRAAANSPALKTRNGGQQEEIDNAELADNDDNDDYNDAAYDQILAIEDNANDARTAEPARNLIRIQHKPLPAIVVRSRVLPHNEQAPPATGHGRSFGKDEARTFFHHKGGSGIAAPSPSFIVFTTPLNLTNINNNTINTPTTTPAPARRLAYLDDGPYLPSSFYRAPSMALSAFRRRAQTDSAQPYGLISWNDAQMLPFAASQSADLRYLPLNLRHLEGSSSLSSLSDGSAQLSSAATSAESLSDAHLNNNFNPNSAGLNGFNLFGSLWRANPNPSSNNIYATGTSPLSAFANNLRRVQYLK